MASKAVSLEPESPSYLDTYGWILYKRGKLDKARDYLEKALDKGGSNDDIILEHYGDILYKSGYTEKALSYWKKAKEAGKGTDLLDKKIADGKLYE
jgi:tetratricopeptide (TPR) repeat protein